MNVVIADFDGTLAVIKRNPKEVKIAKKTLVVLKKLHAVGVKIIVISSRPRKFLQKQFPKFVLLMPNRGNVSRINLLHVARIWQKIEKMPKLNKPGIEIEKTPMGAVIHYRKARSINVRALRMLAEQIAKTVSAKIVIGRKAFEILPVELKDKKYAVENLLNRVKGEVYFFGDDDSDAEAAEVVLKHGGDAFLIRTSERGYTPKKIVTLNGIVHLRKMLLQIVRKEEKEKHSN